MVRAKYKYMFRILEPPPAGAAFTYYPSGLGLYKKLASLILRVRIWIAIELSAFLTSTQVCILGHLMKCWRFRLA